MPSSRLPKLPSIGQLIEHPRIKHLVSRVNHSMLAQRATGFLDEVRVSVAKRAGELEVPSLSSLAERFAHQLLGDAKQSAALINATGVVVGDAALRPPLPQSALDAALLAASEYHDAATPSAEQLLQSVSNIEAAFVAHSFESAVQLTISELSKDGDASVAQDSAGGPQRLIDWESLAVESRVALRGLDDAANLRLVLRAPEAGLTHDSHDPDDATKRRDLESLSALARERGAMLVDVCPLAGLIDPADHGLPSVPTVAARIASGCEVVVIDGAGLLGGPECGIVLGSQRRIEALSKSRLAARLRAAPLTRIALAGVVDLYAGPSPPIHQIPLWQLLSTPLDNLKQRATRLASLMQESESIQAAETAESHSAWCRCGSRTLSAPTWTVKLLPKSGKLESLRRALCDRRNGICVRLADDRSDANESAVVDLRSVFPRWDQPLIEAVEQA